MGTLKSEEVYNDIVLDAAYNGDIELSTKNEDSDVQDDHLDGSSSDQAGSKSLTWQLLALAAHLGWGIMPVAARRLQNPESMPEGVIPIPVFLLIVVLNILAASFLMIYIGISKLWDRYTGRVVEKEERLPWTRKTTNLTIILCVVQFCRAVTNVSSARFTLARWISMMNLTTPLWSAFVDYLFGKPLKPYTIQAVLASIVCSCIVLFSGTEQHALTLADVIGMALQLLSSLCLCLYMQTVQATGGLLTEDEVLYWSNASMIAFAFLGLLLFGGDYDEWSAPLKSLDPEGWLLLISFALVVYFGAALVQQYAVRRIGATGVATLMPVRLVAATIGGMLVLGEPVRSVFEGLGLVMLIIVMVTFIRASAPPSPPSDSVVQGQGQQRDVRHKEQQDDQTYMPVSNSSVRGMDIEEEE